MGMGDGEGWDKHNDKGQDRKGEVNCKDGWMDG